MSFYQEIAKYYDDIFPLKEQTLSFLSSFLPKGKILDIACATGSYTNALNKLGYQTTGIDLDEGMIHIAKVKYPNSSFRVQNMLDIKEEEYYQGLYCIGNSLVHLNGDEIKKALNIMYQALKKDGVIILQIVNYDRILKYNIDHLPTIKNEIIEFIRNYQYIDSLIKFSTKLIVNEKTYENTVDLYPLKYQTLVNFLTEVGFTNIESYGSFNKEPFDIDKSMPLIIKAIK